MEYQFDVEDIVIIDYNYYNNELYLLSKNNSHTKHYISKHNLYSGTVLSVEISEYKLIHVNKSGIYLTYHGGIYKPIPHFDKIVKDKKTFNITESDLAIFRYTIYMETVI